MPWVVDNSSETRWLTRSVLVCALPRTGVLDASGSRSFGVSGGSCRGELGHRIAPSRTVLSAVLAVVREFVLGLCEPGPSRIRSARSSMCQRLSSVSRSSSMPLQPRGLAPADVPVAISLSPASSGARKSAMAFWISAARGIAPDNEKVA